MDEKKIEKPGYERIFDATFHVSAFLCKELLIPLTNEAFGLKLPRDTRVVFLSELQTVRGADGKSRNRVMDTLVSFPQAPGLSEKVRFHFECESRAGNIILRIVEYALMEGVKTAEKAEDGALDVYLPHSVIIYLNSTKNIPDKAEIRMHTPAGVIKYKVPAICLKRYSLEELFERELFILIPFYILRYRDKLAEIEADEAKIRKLSEEIREIERKLDEAAETGSLSLETADRIRESFRIVEGYLLKDSSKIKQEVKSMDGKWEKDWYVIDDPLFYKEEGREEGREERLVDQICKKLRKGKDVPQIADEVEEDEIRVKMICDIAERFEPDYETEKVFEAVQKELIEA